MRRRTILAAIAQIPLLSGTALAQGAQAEGGLD